MQQKKRIFISRVHLILDVAIVTIAFLLSYAIRKFILISALPGLSIKPNYYIILIQIISTLLICEVIFNLYDSFTKKSYLRIIYENLKVITTITIILIISNFIFKIETSRVLMVLFFVLSFTFLFISKTICYIVYNNHYRKEHNKSNVIIIGSKVRARNVIDHIQKNYKNYKIIGCLETDKSLKGEIVKSGVRIIGSLDDLKDLILKNIVDEVIFSMPLKQIDSVDTHILLIEMIGIKVRIFPDWYIHSTVFQPGISKVTFDDFQGSPTILLTATTQNYISLLIKSVSDRLIALISLIILFPFFLVTSLLIMIFSRGPVFFKQDRMGLNGRKFTLYKFRTMVPDAEKKLQELQKLNEADGPAFKITNDPRIIPFIGKFLRKTSIDELPQLINILQGSMSLVGPRPPLPSEVEKYNIWQRRRLSMKPGLTCLWQIKPNRNDLSFNEWMTLDLNYIDNWSLKEDFKILIKTALVVFGGQGR